MRLTVADAEGKITQASADTIRGGETIHSLELTRAADGSYAVAGEVGGKALDGTLRPHEPLRDELAIARLAAKQPNGGTLSLPRWEPDVAPLEPVEATMRCLPRTEDAEQRCELSVRSVDRADDARRGRHGAPRVDPHRRRRPRRRARRQPRLVLSRGRVP